jgi:hypothetical protein
MEICDVCGKELDRGGQNVQVYTAKLIRRGYSKGKLGASVASEYGKFSAVEVKACNRHLRGFWTQRFIPGFIAFIVLSIPIISLVSLIPIWTNDNRSVMFIVGLLVTLIPVTFLVRRITYDAYIASLLTLKPRPQEPGHEYFGQAKYRRIMRNLSRLDAMIEDDHKK